MKVPKEKPTKTMSSIKDKMRQKVKSEMEKHQQKGKPEKPRNKKENIKSKKGEDGISENLRKVRLREEEVEDDEEEKGSLNSDYSDEEPESSGRRSSGAEVHDGSDIGDEEIGVSDANDSDNDDDDVDNDDDVDDDDSGESVQESDSSEDEVEPRNTIGNVPLEFYKEEEHIGYNIAGRKIKKKERKDQLDKFLASADDKKEWRKFLDEYNDEEVEIGKDEIKRIVRILEGKTPHADVDPYPNYVDWFDWDGKGHPLSNAPDPKRRFIPSKWEGKKINKLVRAIREGRIKFDKPKEEDRFYNLWVDDSATSRKTRGLPFIPPSKPKLPGHEESYNPSKEYIPSQEEIDAWQLMYEEDRPKLIPQRFPSLRSVPAYDKALIECSDRHMDLYLCPRTRKKRVNVDASDLRPKNVPKPKDLKPYPYTCSIEYRGHDGAVVSISTEASGQWIASGSKDGTVRVWEVATGRCIRVWEAGHAVQHVAWNPSPKLPILAIAAGQDVLIIDTGLGSEEEQKDIKDLLHVEKATAPDESGNTPLVSWLADDKHGGVRLKHSKTVSSVEWHRRGDYFSTVMPAGQSGAYHIHQLSKKVSKKGYNLHGLAVSTAFHPSRSIFFVATKKNIRVYDLVKDRLIKKLEPNIREVSSIAVHPGGDNIIVGSRDGKLCWFDMDFSSKPYKTLKGHSKDITNVAFHRSYPLFASSSEDCQTIVYHGMVYSDLNQDPLIVPLRKLVRHSDSKERGVLDCKFHPRQPWLFTAGADSVIKLYCH